MGLSAPAEHLDLPLGRLPGRAAAALVFNALDLGIDKATTATAAEQAELRPAASTTTR